MNDQTKYIMRRELRALANVVGTMIALALLFQLGLVAYEVIFGLPVPS